MRFTRELRLSSSCAIGIKKELERASEESAVAAFLRVERKRIESQLAEAVPSEQPQFVWLELTAKKVAKITSPSVDRKRIAGWSWYERVANVETRDAEDLARELARRRIDATQPVPDLSERLPLRLQDEREWSARMALIHYSLDKPLDFQGTGDLLVPRGPCKKHRRCRTPDRQTVRRAGRFAPQGSAQRGAFCPRPFCARVTQIVKRLARARDSRGRTGQGAGLSRDAS